MTYLNTLAYVLGWLAIILTALWGVAIAAVGAVNVISKVVRGRNTSPLGTRQTAPTPAPAPGSFDASQPGDPGAPLSDALWCDWVGIKW